MKSLFYYILLLICFSACNTNKKIVTSKKVAVQRGTYSSRKNGLPEKTLPEKSIVKKNDAKPNVAKPKWPAEVSQNEFDLQEDDVDESYIAEQIYNHASTKIGIKYRSGGTTDAGYDCSGFMYAMFSNFNIKLPRSSHEQAQVGTVINPDREQVKKGDLIFFHTRGSKNINHVGMVIKAQGDNIQFIHSSTTRGIVISSTREPYYKNAFVQVNRVLK